MAVEVEGGSLPPHVSWSSFEAWLSCGKRYQLQKIIRVEQRPGWAAIGGSAVHAATEHLDLAEWEASRQDARASARGTLDSSAATPADGQQPSASSFSRNAVDTPTEDVQP